MVQKTVLGKGLASLLPGAGAIVLPPGEAAVQQPEAAEVFSKDMQAKDETVASRHMGISLAGIEDIKVNPYQPRREFDAQALEELSRSIQENGLIQPLVVRKTAEGYQLIAGERRLRAAKLAGLKAVPIVIKKSTDKEALELALVENLQRQDLNCIDEALAYQQLMDEFSLTQDQVSEKMGKDRTSVTNCLRLLKLPNQIILDLKNHLLSAGHGKVLLSLEDHEGRLKVRDQILEKGLSVRQTEVAVADLKAKGDVVVGANAEASEETPLALRMKTLSHDLTRHWSTRVELKGNEKRGKIVFHYGSREELERLLKTLQEARAWPEKTT